MQNLIMTENVELTDGKAESILATLNGASKLEIVSLKNSPSITAIPNTLANLVALHSLDVSLCDINFISSGSLSFSADFKLLDLTKNFLSDISDDSFEKGI
jgi:Leucine-rich repeat (LRR) protein